MVNEHPWRAGFELEVILGDLGEPRFQRELKYGGMDEATPEFCRAVASALKAHTGRPWSAPAKAVRKPGFYVISEYGLDPIHWPVDRLAGVELLTPPLPFAEADLVRQEITDAIENMDGYFNLFPNEITRDCGWHVNIDAGPDLEIDPIKFILGVDELCLLSANDRLFTAYTGLQRHAVGVDLLRHLREDPRGAMLYGAGLSNFLHMKKGESKSYAANFDKLRLGYLELRHFSADSFFNGPSLENQLERIPAALEIASNRTNALERAFHTKFVLLARWLAEVRQRISWEMKAGIVKPYGELRFDGEPLGIVIGDGFFDANIRASGEFGEIASIKGILLPDLPEAVALMALDLAELHNLGLKPGKSPNRSFAGEVTKLAKRLRADPTLSSAAQLSQLNEARLKSSDRDSL
ncbi:hypothetical protein [Novosphingobium rosa]|uniref:hypothetical protein n=1 Tax=Novosphingobium rosa TaxID=76978 RepID=UPI000834FBB7|nr:hypothetical protein [Novosphingobium rosa]